MKSIVGIFCIVDNFAICRKHKRQASQVQVTVQGVNEESSVKIEDVVESSSRLVLVNEATSTVPNNGSNENLKISNGFNALPPQSNSSMENSFCLNRDIGALFNRLCYSEDVLSSLPNRRWAIHSTEVPEKRIVVSAMMMHNSNGAGLEPLYIKQVSIGSCKYRKQQKSVLVQSNDT